MAKNIYKKNEKQNEKQNEKKGTSSDLDMNIDNYELDDLLNLFNLEFDFGEEELKQAKKVVLMTHPDKSNLSKDYFLFFSSAYKVILSIYEFRNKSKKSEKDTYAKLIDEKDEAKEELLKGLKNKKNFNKVFNELFEKNKIKLEDVDNGYGDWLKSEEDLDTRKTTMNNMNENFERKKRELKAIVLQTGIEDMGVGGNSGHVELTREKPAYYTSSIFSNLGYEDLKKAHVESVVPVTNEDYLSRKQFKNVQELQQFNASQNIKPLSEKESQDYFNNQNLKQNKEDVRRAFKLAKQDESSRKANMNWMSGFKQLM